MQHKMNRRDALRTGAWMAASCCGVLSCRRKADSERATVTLYTSVDAGVARPVIDAFEKQSGVHVLLVTDTEATKAAGLVQRLVAERANPRADVWWSGEVMGTIALARQGLLQPSVPRWLHEEFSGSWPGGLCDSGGLWWGVSQRPRVVVRATSRVREDAAPWSLDQLIAYEPGGRVGIAQPQFGTTRSHFAALAAILGGADALRGKLLALRERGVRLYPGNSAVVRAVAHGEIDLGLTDTDDVWAGRANRWEVDVVYPPLSAPEVEGAVMIPCTVAMVSGKPLTPSTQKLIDFLTSAECERLLATGESGNFPIRSELCEMIARTDARLKLPDRVARIDWTAAGAAREDVDRVLAQVFPV